MTESDDILAVKFLNLILEFTSQPRYSLEEAKRRLRRHEFDYDQ